ncbi:MAG: aminodeoxychorismate synthase, component I [Chloroflexi bacterium HGW-Chloroflexi-6]|nr:MAG: aminodeoxychorismate synthase, component I [Chloroflexi bacterium HGW-Chloroflexi-6]
MNEALVHHDQAWLYFQNPHRIIQTSQTEQVLPALREIETLVEANGWHATGFLSYESAPAFDPALSVHPDPSGFPLLWFGLYPPPQIVELPHPAAPPPQIRWKATIAHRAYNAAIAQIKKQIARGQTYQVNYTMRLQAGFTHDPWDFFLNLAQGQNAHAAYLDTGRFALCSASPELFFTLDGQTITGRPMKGTLKRGRTNAEDAARAAWLQADPKNRAENVMIVDMIRNDLGRIAETGSVHVPELFSAERYPTLWQMTSTVRAQTRAPLSEIFTALFPCASITGAPKVSTMGIIRALETTPRRIYTGSIGFLAPGRQAHFNVAIRTLLVDRTQASAEYGLGGGIVWDSTASGEYEEALLKARILTRPAPTFELFTTLRWTPSEGCFLRERHIRRLVDSAHYFGFNLDVAALETYLDQLTESFSEPMRVRIILTRHGTLSHQAVPLPENPATGLRASLAPAPVNSDEVFLFHKTTRREMYPPPAPGADVSLLYNQRGELTEFTIANLVAKLDNDLVTPPLDCGLLPGTMRAELLESGQVREKIIRIEDLPRCTQLWLVNAVRGRVRVQLV